MTAGAGISLVLLAPALVVLAAGAAKLRRPDQLRRTLAGVGVPRPRAIVPALAVIELGCGALALAAPPPLGAPPLAALFLGFALAHALLRRAGWREDCGCFGDAGVRAPDGARERTSAGARIVANLVAAALAAAAAALADGSPMSVLAGHAGSLAAVLLAASVLALALAALRLLPARARPLAARETLAGAQAGPLAQRLVDGSASLLEQRVSRRSLLVRLAVAGSALSVAPLRYLLYPQPALAVVVPESCASGKCTDGWTAFCCELTGGLNQCPPDTFAGGWWMCTDYPGHQLCREQGVRYYVDCNAIPGRPFPGGCRCANGSCRNRRQNCNVFRYGQCNTHVAGVTPVVCRMVTCANPSTIPGLGCSSSVSIDDAVCGHEAPCLEPQALQLEPAGGA